MNQHPIKASKRARPRIRMPTAATTETTLTRSSMLWTVALT